MTLQFRDVERMSREALIDYVNDLEGRLAEFSGSDDTVAVIKQRFGVRPSGARALIQLANGRPCSRERMFAAVVLNQESDMKSMDAQMCYLRLAIKGTGIVIETIWGVGWQMTAGVEIVQAAMRGEAA